MSDSAKVSCVWACRITAGVCIIADDQRGKRPRVCVCWYRREKSRRDAGAHGRVLAGETKGRLCACVWYRACPKRIILMLAAPSHLLRSCGNVVCAGCSNRLVPVIKFGFYVPVRVCDRYATARAVVLYVRTYGADVYKHMRRQAWTMPHQFPW